MSIMDAVWIVLIVVGYTLLILFIGWLMDGRWGP